MFTLNGTSHGSRTGFNGIIPGGSSREIIVDATTRLRNMETGEMTTPAELDRVAEAARISRVEREARQERLEQAIAGIIIDYKAEGHAPVVIEDEDTGERRIEVYHGYGERAGELLVAHEVNTLLEEPEAGQL